MIHYLDNAATTPVRPEAVQAAVEAMTQGWGNPSSRYELGTKAAARMKEWRGNVAQALGCLPEELFFTSCGTEGDNWAIQSALEVNRRRGKHIITTAIEHAAVLEPCRELERRGYEVTYLEPDRQGNITAAQVEGAMRPDTALVSMMLVNNELGAILPVGEVAQVIRRTGCPALLHCDAVQGFLKIPFSPKKLGVDLLTVSGHKIHGPKGSGFLYINEKVKILPQILGGGQQSGMRSGTDNVPGIAGLGVAAAQIYENLDENVEHMYQLKEHIAEGLSEIEDIRINGMPLREGAPQILSISVMGVRSEVLLHALEDKGIYISAGSACSSHKRKPSATLSAMGMSKDQIESTVRLSFCEENTMEEADYFLQTMKELVPMLRRYSRK